MLPKLADSTQTISFSEGDGVCSAEVFANDVVVTTTAGNHNHGSSKVKLKNLVDYNWEAKYYSGQLLAVHMSGKYLAYSIKAPNSVNPGTCNGMVRVVFNPEPGSDRRALIKGMKGEVQDLAFAHIENQVVLACIDDQGNFYVHEIELTDNGLRCTLLAEIREDSGTAGSRHRVVWCPYIPDDDDQDDQLAHTLLTTHDSIARMWNIKELSAEMSAAGVGGGAGGVGAASGAGAWGAGRGAVWRAALDAAVVDAAFSPDGTALAAAVEDGHVMFYQVYMHNEVTPRCLHKWQPHAGKPLSCLFFLDNRKNYHADDQFWKFAVTGADNNTILKIWSCKSWVCMQTITFTPEIGSEPSMGMKAMLDISATYLLVSDYNTRSMYVLNMTKDDEDLLAYCKSISEFLLPYPVLSFYINDAGSEQVECRSRCSDGFRNGSGDDNSRSSCHGQNEDSDSESEGPGRVKLSLYIVQPKGLQHGEVSFTPVLPQTIMDHMPDPDFTDELVLDQSVVSVGSGAGAGVGAGLGAGPGADVDCDAATASLQAQTAQLKSLLLMGSPDVPAFNLMTPDAFSSPGKREEDDPPLVATPEVTSNKRLSTSATSAGGEEETRSVGSSPSREVQEIMSPAPNPDYVHEQESNPGPSVSDPAIAAVVTNGADGLYTRSEVNVSAETGKLHVSSKDGGWPQFPSYPQYPQFPDSSRRLSSEKSLSHSASHSASHAADIAEEKRVNAEYRAKMDLLEAKIDNLTKLMSGMSHEVRALRESTAAAAAAGAGGGRDVQRALAAATDTMRQRLEHVIADRWEAWSRMGEECGGRAAAAAGEGAARALEPLARSLQRELAVKLAATDTLLRDNIHKMFTNKATMEQLSTSIAAALSDMTRQSFRDAMAATVLPAMEKAHHQIFRQLNQTFQQGTREFCANTESAARAAAERGGASAAAALRQALDRHAAALAAYNQDDVADTVRRVVEKEMSTWRQEARAVVAEQLSRATTPAVAPTTPTQDRQAQLSQIHRLVSCGDVNGAFQLALSASSLSLVVATCRAAPPAALARLRAPVLLSLLQQLAADLNTDAHLKHRYIEEAIMNIDTKNPVTREHLPSVVRELQTQIMAFLATNPEPSLQRPYKMLLMATESLVKNTA